MDEKSFYRAEIARMRAEDPSGNAETIRREEEKHAAEERAEPASEGRTSRLETIGGEEYDPFAD